MAQPQLGGLGEGNLGGPLMVGGAGGDWGLIWAGSMALNSQLALMLHLSRLLNKLGEPSILVLHFCKYGGLAGRW